MKTLSLFLLVSVSGLLVSSMALGHETECCAKIALSISPKKTAEGEVVLTVSLTNRSSETLRFPNGFGPWIGVGASRLSFIAMRLSGNVPIINKSRAIMDPGPGSTEIKAGASVKEDVLLRDFFPEGAAAIKSGEDDVVVFWTYQLIIGGKPISERVGGWLLFPKAQ